MLSRTEDRDPANRKRSSLVEDAYDVLRRAIRENEYPPGFQGSEQEIADRLKMSRTPVHEALIRLQAEGLVRVLPRKGVIVTPVSPEDVREIYDVTIALEAMAADLIAGKPEAERVAIADDLSRTNAEMADSLTGDDLIGWARADERFHRLLIERCGNGRLMRMLSTVLDQSHRARMLTLRLRPKPVQSPKEHADIVEAIRRGDVMAAREAARLHRVLARDQIVPLLAEYGMRHL